MSSTDTPDREILFDTMVAETEAAWLLDFDGEEIWLPKSQCELDEDNYLVTVPEWLARAKGL